jgi:hypothetical protein
MQEIYFSTCVHKTFHIYKVLMFSFLIFIFCKLKLIIEVKYLLVPYRFTGWNLRFTLRLSAHLYVRLSVHQTTKLNPAITQKVLKIFLCNLKYGYMAVWRLCMSFSLISMLKMLIAMATNRLTIWQILHINWIQ